MTTGHNLRRIRAGPLLQAGLTPTPSRRERIAALEAELAELKRQETDAHDQDFLLILQRRIPPGIAFRCTEVLDHAMLHPDLSAAIGPLDARQLGMYFARLASRRPDVLECAYRDERGRHWQLRVAF